MTEPQFFTNYISSKTLKGVDLRLEGSNTILGLTKLGDNCLIGLGSVVGYPSRKKLVDLLKNRTKADNKSQVDTFSISELDEISEGATIGDKCLIRGHSWIYERSVLGNNVETGHNVLIREGVTVGSGTRIGTHTVIEGSISAPDEQVHIGNNVSIQTGVYVAAPATIGSGVFLGPHVLFTNDRYPPSGSRSKITIGEGAVIGANSTLIAGVSVGEKSVVAAASVVADDVPCGWVVKGSPAVKYITVDEYLKKKAIYEKQK